MADFIQEDLNVNVNSMSQLAIGIVGDYLTNKGINAAFGGNADWINMKVSTVFHIIDEIILPEVNDLIKKHINAIPFIGTLTRNIYYNLQNNDYITTIIKIFVILIIQKTVVGRYDILQSIAMVLNTLAVNYISEIKEIKEVIDTTF